MEPWCSEAVYLWIPVMAFCAFIFISYFRSSWKPLAATVAKPVVRSDGYPAHSSRAFAMFLLVSKPVNHNYLPIWCKRKHPSATATILFPITKQPSVVWGSWGRKSELVVSWALSNQQLIHGIWLGYFRGEAKSHQETKTGPVLMAGFKVGSESGKVESL